MAVGLEFATTPRTTTTRSPIASPHSCSRGKYKREKPGLSAGLSFVFVRCVGVCIIDVNRLRILLIGYLYGITSERKLVEELRMHLAWRWFTGWALIRK